MFAPTDTPTSEASVNGARQSRIWTARPTRRVSQVLLWLDDSYDISDASRVCRAWYKTAFPHLHQHMSSRHITYIDALTNRLESETMEQEFQVGPCLRALTIDLVPADLHKGSSRPSLARFKRVLTHLVHLELLEMKYPNCPCLMSIFQSFREHYPRLRWVIIRHSGGVAQDDRNEEVFVFKNMRRLEIGWKHLGKCFYPRCIPVDRTFHVCSDLRNPFHVPGELTKMVEDSPELYELRLDLSAMGMDDDHIEMPWWPSEFFHQLANLLVQLRVLVIGGAHSINWGKFLEGPS
ncbi:hypothetical protein B0J17DRAFT_724435 [Rhizoctonia solani]|nr:hypothetical protein B0J17DRAFT_724435 [Rhizoctonia solani]